MPASAIAAHPLSALAGDLRAAVALLIRRVRDQTQAGDLTAAQKSVILRLERDGPTTVAMLAKAESVRHQSMRVTVASLESAGAVTRTPDPHDGRQAIFTLSAATLQSLRSGRAAKEDWLLAAIRAKLTPREQDELSAAVRLLQRLAEL